MLAVVLDVVEGDELEFYVREHLRDLRARVGTKKDQVMRRKETSLVTFKKVEDHDSSVIEMPLNVP